MKHTEYIRSIIVTYRTLRLVTSFFSVLFLGNIGAHAQPPGSTIVSPLVTGQNFTIAVTASPDVTKATATFSFRPGQPRAVEIPLIQQGQVWTGSGRVPADLRLELPGSAGAMAKIVLVAADGHQELNVVQLAVKVESISAVFEGGILTVTGDDQDNSVTVGPDASGTLLVNGGLVPVAGGVATTGNTSLIRILGLNGDDVLEVSQDTPMPRVNIQGGDGDDKITGSSNDDELDGEAGNDSVFGGRDGIDRLLGGPGNDLLSGGRSNDDLFGGEGDDVVDWLPGDGSDLVEGGEGRDILLFVGSNASEKVDISANNQRLRFFRDIGGITMDCDGIEKVIFNALGGNDQTNVGDLTGTKVTNVAVDLFATSDIDGDVVTVNGTAANDTITVAGGDAGVNVTGLAAEVSVVGARNGGDKLDVNALAGEDTINASEVKPGAIDLIINGGIGNDTLTGGEGSDLIIGAQGIDTEVAGPGDDTSLWNPGDGNDIFEGEEGQDTLLFNGANIAEKVAVSANGSRLTFTRDIAGIVIDCDDTEKVLFTAKGGQDLITVNDLSATDVREVKIDLSAVPDVLGGDAAADSVIVKGTAGNDVITLAGSAGSVTATGLSAAVIIIESEAANDTFTVEALDGDDVVQASGVEAGVVKLIEDGGNDDDNLVGSAGDDTLLGGFGDDALLGGPGLDVLDGGPGANVLIQD